jgi:CRISPR/Cas system-associated exonuclease Cas4 (RecB family)
MLKEIIDNFYLENDRGSYVQKRFYVTDAGKCPRSVFFKFKQAPCRALEARILRLFDHGNYIHELIVKALSGQNVLRGDEVNIPANNLISGRADALIQINGQDYIVDVKSINSISFRTLTEPSEEYIYQLQLYLHFFEIKQGFLLYVNKDTQDLKEFLIEYDQDLCNKLLDSLEELGKKIENNQVPIRLNDWPSNGQCRYCPYKEVCSMVGAEEVSWNDFQEKIRQYEDSIKNGESKKQLLS